MKETDLFLMYRRYGAQTAKLFRKYFKKRKFPGEVHFSDLELKGNYKKDIVSLASTAKACIIFIDENFTQNFLSNEGLECITALEIVEFAKRKIVDPNFEIYTIYLDRNTGFTIEEVEIIKKLFKKAGIIEFDKAADEITQCNQTFFKTMTDDEEDFANKIYVELLNNTFYAANKPKGNFFFGSKATYVDVVLWDEHNGIVPQNINFWLDTNEIDFYNQVKNTRIFLKEEVQNNQMISFVGQNTTLSDNTENKLIDIRYKIIDYKLFHKVITARNELNVDKLLANYNWKTDKYIIPNAMGLAFTVITSDKKIILSSRSSQRSIRPNEYDCSIVEGLSLSKNNIDDDDYLIKEIIRGYCEEICDDAKDLMIKVNGIVLDKNYGQWNIVGTIKTPYTKAQIEAFHALRNDTYEINDLFYIDVTDEYGNLSIESLKENLLPYIRKQMWDMAKVSIYAALVELGFSKEDIDKLSYLL